MKFLLINLLNNKNLCNTKNNIIKDKVINIIRDKVINIIKDNLKSFNSTIMILKPKLNVLSKIFLIMKIKIRKN